MYSQHPCVLPRLSKATASRLVNQTYTRLEESATRLLTSCLHVAPSLFEKPPYGITQPQALWRVRVVVPLTMMGRSGGVAGSH
jgi:hypothetical protein